jgi:hypothetical protein
MVPSPNAVGASGRQTPVSAFEQLRRRADETDNEHVQ